MLNILILDFIKDFILKIVILVLEKKNYNNQLNKRLMPSLEDRIKEITKTYDSLKKATSPTQKIQLSQKLTQLCIAAQKEIQILPPSSKQFRLKTQISNIRQTAIQVKKQSEEQLQKKKSKYDVPSSSKPVFIKGSQQQRQISKKVCMLIVEKQLKSKQIKISNGQLEHIAQRMQKIAEVQQQLKSIIDDHGGNFDLIEININKAVDDTVKANQQLEGAADLQLKARLKKIRLGISGVLAAIGYSILGMPGMIIGGIVALFKSPF